MPVYMVVNVTKVEYCVFIEADTKLDAVAKSREEEYDSQWEIYRTGQALLSHVDLVDRIPDEL